MSDPFNTDFKIATREPSFVMHNQEDDKMKAHTSSINSKLVLFSVANQSLHKSIK